MRGECGGGNMSPAEIPHTHKKKSWKRCGQQLRFSGVLSLSGSFGVFSGAVTARFGFDKCIRDRGLFGLPACFHAGWAQTPLPRVPWSCAGAPRALPVGNAKGRAEGIVWSPKAMWG